MVTNKGNYVRRLRMCMILTLKKKEGMHKSKIRNNSEQEVDLSFMQIFNLPWLKETATIHLYTTATCHKL
jgi:hypothetical protein